MDHKMIEAAHHEAGHVVAGYLNDVLYGRVALYYCEAKARWFGRSGKSRLGAGALKPTPQERANFTLAGMFAESKCIAIRHHGTTVKFEVGGPLDDVLRFINQPQSEECPGSFTIAFSVPGIASHMLTISGEAFSGSDHALFLDRNYRKVLDVRRAITHTMRLLDQPDNWDAIQAIAAQLCEKRSRGSMQLRLLRSKDFAQHLPARAS